MSDGRDPGGRAAVAWGILGVAAVTLALGFYVKDRCVGVVVPNPNPYDGSQFTESCYSDIYVLYSARNLAEAPIPYIEGDGALGNNGAPGGGFTEIGDLEYPAGTGVLVAAASLLSGGDARRFFGITAVGLFAAGLAAVWFLLQIAEDRRRALYFAAAPSIVLYAFHNWDLLAVMLACAGFYAFHRGEVARAGAWTGLGAAAKVFPGALIPAFALAAWRDDRARAIRLVAWSALAFAAVNLPFMLINPKGWLLPWSFQSERFPNFETSWYFLYGHIFDRWIGFGEYGALASTAAAVLFILGGALLLRAEWKRPVVRPYALAAGLVVLFLLTTKVFSPQFALWVLPVFVLVRVPWWSFLAFALTEAATWFAIAGYLVWLSYPDQPHVWSADTWLTLVEVAVWARYGALALLLWRTRVDDENVARRTTCVA